MRGIGAGGAEPAEALVVAVGGGEGDRRARAPGGVHGAARPVERAADLERPDRRELRRNPPEHGARSAWLARRMS